MNLLKKQKNMNILVKKSISLQTFRLSERSVYEERENKEMKTSGKDVMLLEYICYNSASYY